MPSVRLCPLARRHDTLETVRLDLFSNSYALSNASMPNTTDLAASVLDFAASGEMIAAANRVAIPLAIQCFASWIALFAIEVWASHKNPIEQRLIRVRSRRWTRRLAFGFRVSAVSAVGLFALLFPVGLPAAVTLLIFLGRWQPADPKRCIRPHIASTYIRPKLDAAAESTLLALYSRLRCTIRAVSLTGRLFGNALQQLATQELSACNASVGTALRTIQTYEVDGLRSGVVGGLVWRRDRGDSSAVLAVTTSIRTFEPLARETLCHELVHLHQHAAEDILSAEATGTCGLLSRLVYEVEAHVFGSPSLLTAMLSLPFVALVTWFASNLAATPNGLLVSCLGSAVALALLVGFEANQSTK